MSVPAADNLPWPSAAHPGCNYNAATFDDGMFCNKCGWFWSAWPDRVTALQLLLDAIDALPDEQFCPGTYTHIPHDWAFIYEIGWRDAMRQVKALLHPAPEEDK